MPISSDDVPRLIGVHPSGRDWPVNILRFHLVFDREMETGGAADSVAIETALGQTVHGAVVDLPDGLWSPDGRVLTLLLHPGRIKRGLAASVQLGLALLPGQDYQLVVRPRLSDLQGHALAEITRVPFRGAPPQKAPLDPAHWQWVSPDPGSHEPIVVHVGCALDFLSVRHALRVITADGACHAVTPDVVGETLLLHPHAPWPKAGYLCLGPTLEDVCGNRVGASFEWSRDAGLNPPWPDPVTLAL